MGEISLWIFPYNNDLGKQHLENQKTLGYGYITMRSLRHTHEVFHKNQFLTAALFCCARNFFWKKQDFKRYYLSVQMEAIKNKDGLEISFHM